MNIDSKSEHRNVGGEIDEAENGMLGREYGNVTKKEKVIQDSPKASYAQVLLGNTAYSANAQRMLIHENSGKLKE